MTLLAIDGDNLINRSFYGNKADLSHAGQPTNAITTAFSTINRLLRDPQYTHAFIAWDLWTPRTWRYALCEENGFIYKDRDASENKENIRIQKRIMMRMLWAMRFPQYISTSLHGNEADDLLATVSQMGPTHIVSSDKDFGQLLTNSVQILHPQKGLLGPNDWRNAWGVSVSQFIEYQMLAGDSIDSVPNVAGCGHKTAIDWLGEYGDIKTILKHKDELKGKAGKSIREPEAVKRLELARKLITLNKDAYIPYDLEDLHLRNRVTSWVKNPKARARAMQWKKDLGINKVLLDRWSL